MTPFPPSSVVLLPSLSSSFCLWLIIFLADHVQEEGSAAANPQQREKITPKTSSGARGPIVLGTKNPGRSTNPAARRCQQRWHWEERSGPVLSHPATARGCRWGAGGALDPWVPGTAVGSLGTSRGLCVVGAMVTDVQAGCQHRISTCKMCCLGIYWGCSWKLIRYLLVIGQPESPLH